ncbi:MAG: GGDEF domain-containing protein [Bacillota bacterium]
MFDTLKNIILHENVYTVFQPIVSLEDGTVLGHEALSRGPRGIESPDTLFRLARECNKLWELECLCRRKALQNAQKLQLQGSIFLNVSPDIINNPKFKAGFTKETLSRYGIDPEKVIIEITEKSALDDFSDYKKTINHYKEQGYKIAIDDAGSGYSGLKLIADIRPHYVKLDMDIIRNVDKDKFKLALVKSFRDFCGATDIKLVAEGIETSEELETLIEIGVNYAQGYFIQRPNTNPAPISREVGGIIIEMQDKKRLLHHQRPSTLPVCHITRKMAPVSPDTLCSAVADLFTEFPLVSAVPIVENRSVRGLITRDKFYAKLGTQYGYSLFYHKRVAKIMRDVPLIVEYKTPIDVVSKLAMSREPNNVYDSLVVTKNAEYYGIVTVKDLLEKYTEMEINYARHLNPLTGLPGNVSIENKLNECLDSAGDYTVIYVDIDNFKPYNDVYGFASGDRIIQFLSKILVDSVSQDYAGNAFIGHVGGDDFVAVVENRGRERLEQLCKKILITYKENIHAFYNPSDIRRGFIIAKNRHGLEEKFMLSTVSLACVMSIRSCRTIYELAERAGRLKKCCKQISDNCYLIE